MEAQETVFAFEDPVDYLNFTFRERQKKNSRFSLRAWARQVGYENPSFLSDVLKKERKLNLELANKLADNLSLKGKARRYFELAVLYQGSRNDTEKKMYGRLLRTARPKTAKVPDSLSLEFFSMASEWYHWAILHFLDLENVSANELTIQERFGLDRNTAKRAVERLIRLGFITQTPEGQLRRNENKSQRFEPEIPVAALRACHAQFIDKAKEALAEQSREERDVRGVTLSFQSKNIDKAREIIRDAQLRLTELAEACAADEVYQFNTQFFRLTSKKKETIQ